MNFNLEVSKLGLSLNDDKLNKFELYYNELVEVNKYMNLTSIVERDEVYNKHFYDSLTLNLALDKSDIKLCDVGAGAGFPSIPLAIVRDDIDVTIIDALNKRINFLNDLIKKLGLNNAKAIHARAEDFTKTNREAFDVVTARAVARLNVLVELCMPLVKLDGLFIAMKGTESESEIKEAEKGIQILGGKIEKVIDLDLPDNLGKRELVIIRKIKNTPNKYPRMFAKIKERPL